MYEALVGTILAIILAAGLGVAGVLVIVIWKKDRTRKVTFLRLFIQLFSLIAIFYSFTMALWLSMFLIVILVATLFTGRFFCGWICPFGFYMDLVALVRKAVKVRYRVLPDRLNIALHKTRYILAAIILVSPLVLGGLAVTQSTGTYALFLRGPYKSLNLMLSPLEPLVVPFAGSVATLSFVDWSISYPYAREIMFYINIPLVTSVLVYFFIAATLLGTFVFRRFWCRFCPTGLSLAAANKFKAFKWAPLLHINKTEEKCTKCGICKRVCPVQVTEVYEQKGGEIITSVCLNCTRCIEMCPYEGCLKWTLKGKTLFKSRNWLEPAKTE